MTERSRTSTDNDIEFAWSVINHVDTAITSADNKATAIIAIQSIVIGFMLSGLAQLVFTSAPISPVLMSSSVEKLLVVVILLTITCSILCALLCLISRYGLHESFRRIIEPNISRPSAAVIFFGTICELDQQKYIESIRDLDESSKYEDLLRQIHTLSVIAREKHKWLNRGMVLLTLTLISVLVLSGVILF